MKFTPRTNVPTKTRFDIYSYGVFQYSTFDAKIAEAHRLMEDEIKLVEVQA